jgi:N-dimethylarginine dimethylaminohydrolase
MCKPSYFGIEYEINPWMNLQHQANLPIAISQWQVLHDTIVKCGATVELVTPVKGLPDMVFTANAGLWHDKKIVLAHFKHAERQGETDHFAQWFKKAGFDLIEPGKFYFEGAGDALYAGDKLFAGYGFRTDKHFYQSPVFEQTKLIYCQLIDPYFYHIDTCFCPITDELAIWYPAAFSLDSQKEMRKNIELIPVHKAEAERFACNAVVIDKHAILPANCPEITHQLHERGFTVHTCTMHEYLKAGGACKCLTLRIS